MRDERIGDHWREFITIATSYLNEPQHAVARAADVNAVNVSTVYALNRLGY
jgi:hypothetical protein